MGKGILIAATSSGCGKTTLTLGLLRALRRRGIDVAPFKCGPDYIDTQFHRQAAGEESVNLDGYMMTDTHLREQYTRFSAGKDISVVEGVMGMFDGYRGMNGSSGEIARTLSLPVVLLVNAASTAYSVAALISGFVKFDREIRVAGVIFNRVSSKSHFSILREACEDIGIECLGYLKKDERLGMPSRHLGLTIPDRTDMETFINAAADAVEENVDIERVIQLAGEAGAIPAGDIREIEMTREGERRGIAAVASDEAFSFIYAGNLTRLQELGYDIVKFSPLHARELPPADFVYFPGGYPELYARSLSENCEMRRSVREYVERGGKVWAECGGMMYLTESIDNSPMCGIFRLRCSMDNPHLRLGYRSVRIGEVEFKGHEFHYSRVGTSNPGETVGEQRSARGRVVDTPVYRYRNVYASYTHLYWGEGDIFKLWEK